MDREELRRTIFAYLHCEKCGEEMKENPRGLNDYARLAIGWTVNGLRVQCLRHNEPVALFESDAAKTVRNESMALAGKTPEKVIITDMTGPQPKH